MSVWIRRKCGVRLWMVVWHQGMAERTSGCEYKYGVMWLIVLWHKGIVEAEVWRQGMDGSVVSR